MWAVYNIQAIEGKMGRPVYRIDSVDLTSSETATGWIDPTYRNYSYWRRIVTSRGRCFILSGLEIFQSSGRNTINADFRPVVEWQGSREDLIKTLERFFLKNS